MKNFRPMLFTDLKTYNKSQLLRDIIAGIIVAIIALPLSIALAIASGVSPEAGIYTAIIAGFLTALLGGSSVQIAGPTAAFATIVAGIVARNGMDGLALATVMAGIILLLMGLLGLGSLIRFIPYSITTGFTAGIAVTLVIGQLKDFCGVRYMHGEAPIETVDKLKAFFANLDTVNLWAVLVGAVCLVILFGWSKISDKIPASLIAVAVGIAMVQIFRLDVLTIGDQFTLSSALPAFTLPKFSIAAVTAIFPDALTIAVLAGIESLLSCVVADGMVNKKHRSNTELCAQGIANVGSALFGGIPATGAIARTAANIRNGGRTPISGIVHSLTLLLILVILMPYASYIPMPAIAAILIHVAYNMCGAKAFVRMIKTSPKSDILVLLLTFALTVVFDLVVAIGVGVVLACVLFVKRMSEEGGVSSWRYDEDEELRKVPEHIRVYELSGPLFFAVSGRLSELTVKDFTRCVVLRMRSVPSLDTDALRGISDFCEKCHKNGIVVVFSHVNPQPLAAMKKAGLYDTIGAENFRPNIEDALRYAETI